MREYVRAMEIGPKTVGEAEALDATGLRLAEDAGMHCLRIRY